MKSHTGRVSRAAFSPVASAEHMAYSCGLDSTLRSWDIANGVCTSTIVCSILISRVFKLIFPSRL
jgi:ribosome biogenesis protein